MSKFKVICNGCGSEDVAVYLTTSDDIIFECENCGINDEE